MQSSSSHGGHVAIFTFPFTSHPLPLFNLVCKLANAAPEIQFSFFSSAKSINSILSQQKTSLPLNLKPYNLDGGIAKGYDSTEGEHKEVVFFINSVPENFKRGLDMAVRETGQRITHLVADAFFSFAVGEMAEEMKVPWVAFWVGAPYALSAHFHMDVIRQIYMDAGGQPDQVQTLKTIPGLSAFHLADLPLEVHPVEKGNAHSELFAAMIGKIGLKLPSAAAVVMNSFEEINSDILTEDLKSKFQNFLYVGFLTVAVPPLPLPPSNGDSTGCLSWLDTHKPASVVYISFGTITALPVEELVALAEAIEVSGIPFLWSLKDNYKGQLPDGFLERTSKQGKVVPWTRQTEVLGHGSTGVHVTHCGYNSVCESILGGVPMICRSIWADNHMNRRMVEEAWGIGVRVEGGVITKSGMLKSLEIIFEHEQGKKIREAINGLKEVVLQAAGPDGVAAKDFKTLVQIISK